MVIKEKYTITIFCLILSFNKINLHLLNLITTYLTKLTTLIHIEKSIFLLILYLSVIHVLVTSYSILILSHEHYSFD